MLTNCSAPGDRSAQTAEHQTQGARHQGVAHRAVRCQPRNEVASEDCVNQAVQSGQHQQVVGPVLFQGRSYPARVQSRSVAVERTIPTTIPAKTARMLRPMGRDGTAMVDGAFISLSPVRKSATSVVQPTGHSRGPWHARSLFPGPCHAQFATHNEASGLTWLRHLLR